MSMVSLSIGNALNLSCHHIPDSLNNYIIIIIKKKLYIFDVQFLFTMTELYFSYKLLEQSNEMLIELQGN